MSITHNPVVQASGLRECLSQSKRPLGFFLGAGCPVSIQIDDGQGGVCPLIPDTAGLTKLIFDELSKGPLATEHSKLCQQFIADGLQAPTLETMLSHVRALKLVAGSAQVRGLTREQLESVDNAICKCVEKHSNKPLPSASTPYHLLASWIGSVDRLFPVELFTTNYDLLIEQAMEETRVPYFDGFVGTVKTFFDLQAIEDDKLPSRWARLWKIHGSLNWAEDDKGAIRRERDSDSRKVVYPSHLKYDESRRLPYLAMIDRLKAFLRRPASVLVSCGYSFGDNHLNEIIVQGLQGNPQASVFALLYGSLAGYASATKMATTRSNLHLIAADGGVLGTREGTWNEVPAATSTDNSIAIRWDAKPADPSLKVAKFELGNFENLGQFVADLIGAKEASDGK